jgi:hypothetical protein
MTRRVVHYQVEIFHGTLAAPLCENQAGRDAIADAERECSMSDDEAEVTCAKCFRALGYEPAPVERLTVCERDPLRKAA